MLEWEPIDTAPKDGRIIWASRYRQDDPHVMHWDYHSSRWVAEDIWGGEYYPMMRQDSWRPTHWTDVSYPKKERKDDE